MLIFLIRYFIITGILLVSEVLIALFVHDNIVRPYIGDFLVVILLYCFVRTLFKVSVIPAAIGVLLFSFLVEILQAFHFISLLGLEHSTIAKIVLGNSFAWTDLLMYVSGFVVVIMIEKYSYKMVSQDTLKANDTVAD